MYNTCSCTTVYMYTFMGMLYINAIDYNVLSQVEACPVSFLLRDNVHVHVHVHQ